MRKFMLILTVAATGAAMTPGQAAAQECTRGYQKCLNDTHDTRGMTRILADVECFASYLKCVRSS